MFEKSNVSDIACPLCDRKLRFKPPCCSDKRSYLVCPCGYKKVRDGVDTVHHSSGSNDSANVQS